jgi:hypothetical protein
VPVDVAVAEPPRDRVAELEASLDEVRRELAALRARFEARHSLPGHSHSCWSCCSDQKRRENAIEIGFLTSWLWLPGKSP